MLENYQKAWITGRYYYLENLERLKNKNKWKIRYPLNMVYDIYHIFYFEKYS